MITLGITGSIGMGKSTAAEMLRELGIPVHEADTAVHELLAPGGRGYFAVAAAFPLFSYPKIYKKLGKNKVLDRKALGDIVFHDDEKREKLESILHPLVREAQAEFLRHARLHHAKIAALDIPLLFETGADQYVDYTVNVSAPYPVQKQRVLARPAMDEEKFHAILARQMPDAEKCARADFVLHSGLGRAEMMTELKRMIEDIKKAP